MHPLSEFSVFKLVYSENIFLYLFNKYLLVTQNVLASVLSVGETLAAMRDKVLVFMHVTLQINKY